METFPHPVDTTLIVRVRSRGRERGLELLGCLEHAVGERERDRFGMQLLGDGPNAIRCFELGSLQNLDSRSFRATTASHILVEHVDGFSELCGPEFFVRVVSSRSRLVSEPESKVLDFGG